MFAFASPAPVRHVTIVRELRLFRDTEGHVAGAMPYGRDARAGD